jgi:HlyD family secretion protein
MNNKTECTVIRRRRRRSRKPRLPGHTFVVILLAAAFALVYFFNNTQAGAFAKGGNDSPDAAGQTGFLNNNIEVVPYIDGKISRVYLNEGDAVRKNDLLYELDDSELKLRIEQIKSDIKMASLEAGRLANSLDSLKIRAPFNGLVTNLSVYKNNALTRNDNILNITDTSRLKLLVPFSSFHISGIKPGQAAKVCVWSFMGYYDARVSFVSDKPYYTEDGGKMYYVEVEVDNPGAFKEGMEAHVEITTGSGTAKSLESGRLEYIEKATLRPGIEGNVRNIYVRENQFVRKGELLLELENKDLVASHKAALLRLEELRTLLKYTQEQLRAYKIYAPAEGTLLRQYVRVGSIVSPGEAVSVIAAGGI